MVTFYFWIQVFRFKRVFIGKYGCTCLKQITDLLCLFPNLVVNVHCIIQKVQYCPVITQVRTPNSISSPNIKPAIVALLPTIKQLNSDIVSFITYGRNIIITSI